MNKAVLITGAARRIGRYLAVMLARKGFDIAIHCNTSRDEASKLMDEINALGSNAGVFESDLENEKETESLIGRVRDRFPNLEVLINNASVFIRSNMAETGMALFNRTMNINLKAPYILSRDFAGQIKKGVIINMLDTKISKNNFNYSAYTLSKKALANLTLMSAKEFAPGIRVNGICPGVILEPAGKSGEYLEELAKSLPLKRKGEQEDVFNAAEFLIGNQFITGEILYVDGGENL